MVSIIDEDNLSEEKVGEEGSDDNDNNEEVIPASSHASKRRISTTDIWNGNFYCTDVSQEHIETKYLDLANQTFGGGGTLGWICKDKPYVRRLSGIKVTKKRCAFFNVCDCPFVIRELYSTQSQLASIEIGEIPHANHNMIREGATRGVPRYIQSILITSPSKLSQAPSKFVAAARKKGVVVDEKLNKSMRRKFYRMRSSSNKGTPSSSTWGGIATACETYRKERIANFGMHSVYLLGLECNAEIETIVAVFSTENLLLNGYRQTFWGNPICFGADASYRLTKEKNGLFPVVTTNIAMETKTIAYGLISHEHHKAQRFIFQTIKTEIEKVVRRRLQERQTI
jgi:hypothetical protein